MNVVWRRFFDGGIRSQDEFQARVVSASAQIMSAGSDYLEKVLPLLQQFESCRSDLARFAESAPATAPLEVSGASRS